MKWHTNITIGDLCWMRAKFARSRSTDGIYLSNLLKTTEAYYNAKHFRVNGEFFLTWAFLTPEWEIDYLNGKFGWLDNMSKGNPWIMEAYMPGQAMSSMRELKHLIPTKILRFKRGHYLIDKMIIR